MAEVSKQDRQTLLTRLIQPNALEGRKAMVFGASSGIGYACARSLADLGAELVMVARNRDKLERAAEAISAESGRAVLAEAQDITDVAAMQSLLSRHQDCDILLTNCGGPPVGPFESLTLDQWEAAWQAQLRSALQATRALAPAMSGRGWGRVILLASITLVHPLKGFALSNSIRPGLSGLAATLTQEYAAQGVTANAVCPGITATERMEKLLDQATGAGRSRQEVLTEWIRNIPAGRMAAPHEIAALAAFLATDAAAFITGQTLVADGGESVAG